MALGQRVVDPVEPPAADAGLAGRADSAVSVPVCIVAAAVLQPLAGQDGGAVEDAHGGQAGVQRALAALSRRTGEEQPATGASETSTAQAPHPPSAHPTLHPVKGVLVRMKLARVSVGSGAS